MSIQEKFKEIIINHKFDVLNHIFLTPKDDLSQFTKEQVNNALSILEGNISGEVQYFGGSIEKSKDQFEAFIDTIKKDIEAESNDNQKELNDILKKYVKILKEYTSKCCYAIIPVKDMPWTEVLFRTVPKIVFKEKTIELIDRIISYYGEIKCLISKTIIHGRIKGEHSLFAPVIGDLDLNYELDDANQKAKKSFNYSYVSAIINSLESTSMRNHLTRYHEGYQRRGDPICDFLMKKDDLINVFDKLMSCMESGRINNKVSIIGIALPQSSDKTTLVIVLDESENSGKYEKCFEALLRLSAACCEAPKPQIQPQQAAPLRTPGGQELKVWTAEELADQASQRGSTSLPPGMDVWTEEELQKMSVERQSSLPEGMETWTAEELQELAKKRQGNLDIPTWEPDKDMSECSKCGYGLRKGWDECPICGAIVGAENDESQEDENQEDEDQEDDIESNEESVDLENED